MSVLETAINSGICCMPNSASPLTMRPPTKPPVPPLAQFRLRSHHRGNAEAFEDLGEVDAARTAARGVRIGHRLRGEQRLLQRLGLGLGPERLTDEARERLVGADWPGNVRELENVISRGVLRAARQKPERAGPLLIGVESLDLEPAESSGSAREPSEGPALRGRTAPSPSLAERVEAFRRKEILTAVVRHRGNWAAAARELGLHRSNFHHLAKHLGIRKEQ